MTINLFDLRDRIVDAEDRVILVSVAHLEHEPIPDVFLEVGGNPVSVSRKPDAGYLMFSIPVIAEVYGDWGIHCFMEDEEKVLTTHWSDSKAVTPESCPSKYSITHVPSGLRLMSVKTLLSARLMIAHIESSRFWELFKEHGPKLLDFAEGQDALTEIRQAAGVFKYPLAEDTFGGLWPKEAS